MDMQKLETSPLKMTKEQEDFEDMARQCGVRGGIFSINAVGSGYLSPFVQMAWIGYNQINKGKRNA